MRDAAAAPVGDAKSAALDEAVGLAFRILKAVMVVMTVLFLMSGFFTVAPHEVAFVRQLGRVDPEPRLPGGHLSLPLAAQVLRVDTRPRRFVLETFDVQRTPEEVLAGRLEPREGGLDPARDGYVLSGDANVLHLALASRVGVSEPLSWLTSVRDTDELTQVLLERAVVQGAARREVEELLGMGKADFTAEVRRILQQSFDALEVGLEVTGLDMERDLVPPGQARLAFEGVVRATQESDRLRAGAERAAADTEGRAHTESAQLAGAAVARAARLKSDAEATARVVESLREQWERSPRELEQRLLVRGLGEAFPKVEEVFLLPKGELRIRLKRDTRARAREQERKAKEFTRRGY